MDSVAPRAVSLTELVGVFLRRRRLFYWCLAGGLLLTLVLLLALPSQYLSKATILIEQQEIPQEMVRSTITSYADQRLQIINQRVISSRNLVEMAEKFDLYPRSRYRMAREELVEQVRSNVDFEIVSAEVMDPRRGIPTQAAIAFSIGYTDRNPSKAYQVANELSTLYLNENLKNRADLARQTTMFLGDETGRLDREVQVLEQELAEFKEKHVLELPELLQLNWQMHERYLSDIRDTKRGLDTVDDQIVYLESQLAQVNPYEGVFSETGARLMSPAERLVSLKTELAQMNGRYLEQHPDTRRVRAEIESLESEVDLAKKGRELRIMLEDRKAELARIRGRYSEEHPDVVLLTSQISALIELLSETVESDEYTDPTNPAYIQIQTNLKSANLERESLTRLLVDLEMKLEEVEGRIARTPEIERQYREQSRKYQNAASKFTEVRAKQMEAELAQSLEMDRKGERFTLIDPPQIPEQPAWPNRYLIFLLGLIGTGLAALGSVLLSESLDQRVYGNRRVVEIIGLTPLGEVPMIVEEADKGSRQRARLVAGAGALACGTAAMVFVHFFVTPLDAFSYGLLRSLGAWF